MSFITILVLSGTLTISASAADRLSPETRQLLEDANKNRVERLRDRFKPIIQTLDAETLKDFPENPDFKKVESRLIEWSSK